MVRPGDNVAGRYVVVDRIAEGGMGVLWRARHTELDVEVALKVMSPKAATPGALKRFKREAQAVARLRSQHIVHMLDYGVFEDEPYLVMELLRGEDLAALLLRERRLSVERCERIITGVGKALEVAHEAGIVHRDLKPANIFLERIGADEVVKVLDFGVAKDLEAAPDPASTTTAGGLGSPAYMSPEQVWGEATGHPTDLWAMGVLAYEMLAGKNPFLDQTLAAIFERIVRHELPPITAQNPELPASFDEFFARALARSAKDRWGSASEFLSAFRDAARGIGTTGPLPAKLDPAAVDARVSGVVTERTRDRNKPGAGRRWALVGVALGLIAVVGALLLAGRRSAESSGSVAAQPTHEPEPAAPPPGTAAEASPTPANEAKNKPSPIALVTADTRPSAASALGRPPRVPPAQPSRSEPKPAPTPSTGPGLDPRFGIPLDK